MYSCTYLGSNPTRSAKKLQLHLHFLPGPSADSPSSDLSHSEPHEWTIVPFSGAPWPQQSLQLERRARLPWPEGTLTAEEDHWTAKGIFGNAGESQMWRMKSGPDAMQEDQESELFIRCWGVAAFNRCSGAGWWIRRWTAGGWTPGKPPRLFFFQQRKQGIIKPVTIKSTRFLEQNIGIMGKRM